jgi:aralkylamine N-acetyltransferase
MTSRGVNPFDSEARQMRIERSDINVSWDAVATLFRDVGWGQRQPSEIHAAFDRSSIKTFAFEGPDLIGFGRAIDDSRYYATIVDVVVSPTHQRRGIGRAILEDLHRQLDGFLVVTLTALPEVQPFYQRLGWRKLTTGMIRPRSEEQARLSCADSN